MSGEQAYITYRLYTNDDGSISGDCETNDDCDRGYPSEHASWDVRYKSRERMLERTGGSHYGCSGIKVSVYLDGEEVPERSRYAALAPPPPAVWSVVEWKHRNAGGSGLVLHSGLWSGPAAFGLQPGDPFFTLVTGPTPWGCGSWGPFPTSAIVSTRELRRADTWRYGGSEARWNLDDLLRALDDARCVAWAASLRDAIKDARGGHWCPCGDPQHQRDGCTCREPDLPVEAR